MDVTFRQPEGTANFWQHKKEAKIHLFNVWNYVRHILSFMRTEERKHIRCILCIMMLFFSLALVCLLLASQWGKINKSVPHESKMYIHTEKMFLLRSIFDVSGPSASEFLIFFSLLRPNTHAHPAARALTTWVGRSREKISWTYRLSFSSMVS